MELQSTLDRTFVECSALGFQSIVTIVLAVACHILWRRQRAPHFRTWSAAWGVYVIRLSCMFAFLIQRDTFWLFAHQAATGLSAPRHSCARGEEIVSKLYRLALGEREEAIAA